MLQTVIPQGYAPCLNLYDTQKAIGLLKRLFEDTLGGALHLRRVSAPLFVEASTGLNDDLNGVERAGLLRHSRRRAGRTGGPLPGQVEADGPLPLPVLRGRGPLHRHERHPPGRGAGQPALRLCGSVGLGEDHCPPGPERRLSPKQTVRTIVAAMAETQHTLRSVFPQLTALPPLGTEVSFVTTQELEELWPDRSPKEREDAWVKEHPVTFLMGIGGALKSGQPTRRPGPRLRRLDPQRGYPGVEPSAGAGF